MNLWNVLSKNKTEQNFYSILNIYIIAVIIITGLFALITRMFIPSYIIILVGFLLVEYLCATYLEPLLTKVSILLTIINTLLVIAFVCFQYFIVHASYSYNWIILFLLIIFTFLNSIVYYKYCIFPEMRKILIAQNILFLIILSSGLIYIAKLIKFELIDIINININILLILLNYIYMRKDGFRNNQYLIIRLAINFTAMGISIFRVIMYNL